MSKHFRNNADYKSAFSTAVDELIARRIEDRTERMAAIQALVTEYIDSVGMTPDVDELERLANEILYEELTDDHPDKVTREEYPILSERQLERRRNNEVSYDQLPDTLATDGRDYRKPTRRKRTVREMMFVDEHAKSRNRERNQRYSAFRRGGAMRPLEYGGKWYASVKI